MLRRVLQELEIDERSIGNEQRKVSEILDELVERAVMTLDGRDLAERIILGFRRSEMLASTFSPHIFKGSLLFLRATGSDLDVAGWDPYVAGDLTIHDVPGHHDSILDGHSGVRVGHLLNEALRNACGGTDAASF